MLYGGGFTHHTIHKDTKLSYNYFIVNEKLTKPLIATACWQLGLIRQTFVSKAIPCQEAPYCQGGWDEGCVFYFFLSQDIFFTNCE